MNNFTGLKIFLMISMFLSFAYISSDDAFKGKQLKLTENQLENVDNSQVVSFLQLNNKHNPVFLKPFFEVDIFSIYKSKEHFLFFITEDNHLYRKGFTYNQMNDYLKIVNSPDFINSNPKEHAYVLYLNSKLRLEFTKYLELNVGYFNDYSKLETFYNSLTQKDFIKPMVLDFMTKYKQFIIHNNIAK